MGFFSRIISTEIPAAFFSNAPESIDAAFVSSHRKAAADGRVLKAQIAYARGTDRYFAVQRGIVDAALSVGGEDFTARLGPAGFPMPLVRMGQTIVASCITDSLDHLRRSRARSQLAALNAVFEPVQPSLWEEDAAPTIDGYRFAMLLIAKPHRDADQSLPGGIFFGVPTSSLRSWHFYERVDVIRALYDEADWAETPSVKDRRFPRLRETPRSIEDDDSARSEG